ncbi:MAG: cyclic nucleotide-binding domain-containing protein [SAR324 cluster bacterium]|nr:cyclic nucleotide-binding domain-containing protein [SAR324 cluster bacterium]
MPEPQSNYLKNTVPELEEEFIEEIGKIPLFSQLSHELRHQLFSYSKFVKLQHQEKLIKRGMFDQEIFVLLQGKLNVLVPHNDNQEIVIDVMDAPFSLFGERSLLGEPRGSSIDSEGESLLLGIDLSPLPDVLEAFETPETRQQDAIFAQNIAMYTIIATALIQRLERLVDDQYKLKQKIGAFEKRQDSWKQEWWLSRVFNQMNADKLTLNPEIQDILLMLLKKHKIEHPSLEKIILSQQFGSRRLHTEMIRLNALGELEVMEDFILDSVREIAEFFCRHPDYSNLGNINLLEVHEIPKITTLSNFLEAFFNSVLESKILAKPLSKKEFLDSVLDEEGINPSHFSTTLRSKGWVSDNFSQAYLLYLSCQQCIYHVTEANQTIRNYIHFLTTYNTPKQSASKSNKSVPSVSKQFLKMQERHESVLANHASPLESNSSEESSTPGESNSAQNDAEDLLKSLGL